MQHASRSTRYHARPTTRLWRYLTAWFLLSLFVTCSWLLATHVRFINNHGRSDATPLGQIRIRGAGDNLVSERAQEFTNGHDALVPGNPEIWARGPVNSSNTCTAKINRRGDRARAAKPLRALLVPHALVVRARARPWPLHHRSHWRHRGHVASRQCRADGNLHTARRTATRTASGARGRDSRAGLLHTAGAFGALDGTGLVNGTTSLFSILCTAVHFFPRKNLIPSGPLRQRIQSRVCFTGNAGQE